MGEKKEKKDEKSEEETEFEDGASRFSLALFITATVFLS